MLQFRRERPSAGTKASGSKKRIDPEDQPMTHDAILATIDKRREEKEKAEAEAAEREKMGSIAFADKGEGQKTIAERLIGKVEEQRKSKFTQQQIRMRDRRMYLLSEGIRRGEPKISLKVLLARGGVAKYYSLFRDIGYDVIEMYALKTNQECEDILVAIERKNKMKLPYEDRTTLWKILRYRHFDAPASHKRYIEKDEIPKLFLTKKDHRIGDAETDFSYLEPDRQRQVIRKHVIDLREGRRLVQLEIYERHSDIVYNLKDLQRNIKEWQNRDPRNMLREDPREEVFLMRIRKLELQVASQMTRERKNQEKKDKLIFALSFIRYALLVMACVIMFLAASEAQKKPAPMFMYFFTGSPAGSKMFISAIAFLKGAFFCLGLQKRRNTQLLQERLLRMHSVCKKLNNYLVNFRLQSNEQRLDKMNEELEEMTRELKLFEEIDWTKYKKQKTSFNVWFSQLAARKFNADLCYEDVKRSYQVMPKQKVPAGQEDRLTVKIGKIRDASNPHKRGIEIKRSCANKHSLMLAKRHDVGKEWEQIKAYDEKLARRQERLEMLLDEGYGESDIESEDLCTTPSEKSDETSSMDTEALEEYNAKHGIVPLRTFTPPSTPEGNSESKSQDDSQSESDGDDCGDDAMEMKPLTGRRRIESP